MLSCVCLFATPWTAGHRLLCPWGSPGQSTGVGTISSSGAPSCPSSRVSPVSPALAGAIPTEPLGKPRHLVCWNQTPLETKLQDKKAKKVGRTWNMNTSPPKRCPNNALEPPVCACSQTHASGFMFLFQLTGAEHAYLCLCWPYVICNGSTMIRNMLFYCRKPNVVMGIIRFLTTDYELGVSPSQGQLQAPWATGAHRDPLKLFWPPLPCFGPIPRKPRPQPPW